MNYPHQPPLKNPLRPLTIACVTVLLGFVLFCYFLGKRVLSQIAGDGPKVEIVWMATGLGVTQGKVYNRTARRIPFLHVVYSYDEPRSRSGFFTGNERMVEDYTIDRVDPDHAGPVVLQTNINKVSSLNLYESETVDGPCKPIKFTERVDPL